MRRGQLNTPLQGGRASPSLRAVSRELHAISLGGRRQLVGELTATTAPELRDVILDLPRTSDSYRRRALVHDTYKIIAYDDDYRFEVYDLAKDPGEKRDLRKVNPELYETMKARYLEHIKTIHEVCPKMRNRLKGKRREKPC